MRRFSFIVLSFTRHLYREYKSVQITVRIHRYPSQLVIIANISEARTLHVTLLHFVELK
ncbi:hypothetical protein LX36DRAFT_646988 [Colletotrichum falcatum]|nr:hypothetical protein LX36DRAFT_646988 [Colletotrichum falcatum]